MSIALLVPRVDHHAIEERYASWQARMILRSGAGVTEVVEYDPDDTADEIAMEAGADEILAVTDPLLLGAENLGARLSATMHASGALAAVPVSNVAQFDAQRREPSRLYLTLGELQAMTDSMAQDPAPATLVQWDRSDPGVFLCRAGLLDDVDAPLRFALDGLEVAVSNADYVHRWSSLRGQAREDLLGRISLSARSVLEFGCGEAPLGEALKRRQPCRVVGVEIDPAAAAVAATRIDAVHRGDVREIVARIDDRFDCIVGGDIVEHLDEPWSFLTALRRIALPGATLLLSIPNLANASVIGDLVRGRFDYVYMGITCVGHLRFFTRRTIEEMLAISGWEVVEVTPQFAGTTPTGEKLVAALEAAGVAASKDDLLPTGYYVTARNPA